LLKIFKNYLLSIIIFNYNRFFFGSNNFNLFIKFYYYLINKHIFFINLLTYKDVLSFKYTNIFILFKIFKYNINNFIFIFNNFISILSKKIITKKNYKIYLNFFSKIYYKFSSNLKLSLIYLNKYLDILFFYCFKNLCFEDILLKHKLKKAFKGDNKNYFLIMKE
jgi:hypothetical protein